MVLDVLIQYLGTKEAGPVFTFGMAKGLKDNGVNVKVVLSDRIENYDLWIEEFGEENISFIRATPKKKKVLSTTLLFLSDCLNI